MMVWIKKVVAWKKSVSATYTGAISTLQTGGDPALSTALTLYKAASLLCNLTIRSNFFLFIKVCDPDQKIKEKLKTDSIKQD